MKLSVIICTYNRARLLNECLASLFNQNIKKELYEVMVVDNNSSDDTKLNACDFLSKNPNFSYYFEPRQGLSHARNTGFKFAKANWVLYIDDDAKADPNLVERTLWTIENYDFDAFGGRFFHWFKYGKPKWFPENFEGNGVVANTGSAIEINNEFFNGGVMVFKKSILEKLNGFPCQLGMNGRKIAYGEETMLQLKMRNAGFKLGYDPELKVHHIVGEHKLKLSWHIRSAYAHSRDSYGIGFSKYSPINLIKDLVYIFLKKWPKAIAKLLLRKNYYWQNMVLDMLQPVAACWGSYIAVRKASS